MCTLLDLHSDVLLGVLTHLDCTLDLQRMLATCRVLRLLCSSEAAHPIFQKATLVVPVYDREGAIVITVADALKRAPPGARMRISAGIVVTGNITLKHPLHVTATGACLHGTLRLLGGHLFSEASAGLVHGLHIRHFDNEAVVADAGDWTLRDVMITSLRRTRASTSITVRNAASLVMEDCSVKDCNTGACIARPTASLHFKRCLISSVREAIVSQRGGTLVVEETTFEKVCRGCAGLCRAV